MDKQAVATDSSGVPSTIERSPLDFAHETEASGMGTAAPEMPPPEDVTWPRSGLGARCLDLLPSILKSINGPVQFDSCSKSYEGENWEPPPCPHEVPLLTLTPTRVIEMDEPAVATDSSGVPSTIERSPLDFAHEAEASGRGTVAPEMPPPEDVPTTTAPGADQAVKTVAAEPPAARESRCSRGEKSLAAMQLCLASNVFVSEGVAAVGDPESENVSSPAEVGSPGSVYRQEWGVTNGCLLDTPEACQDLVDHAAPPSYFFELRHMHNEDFLGQYNINLARQVAMGSQLRLRWVIGHRLRLAMMKCAESLEMRSDGVLVSVPTVVPQGLALLL
nr:hypothetical protein [Tanacetum cinerariifolium]